MAKHYDNPWLQKWIYRRPQDAILANLRARGSRHIVDVGCGTGLLADRLQRELLPAEVTGVDPSRGMLANAKARSSDVRWLVGTAEQLPLPDSSQDAITSTTAFHFFDQAAALADFHRVLVPGGIVAIATVEFALPTPASLERLLDSSPFAVHYPSAAGLRKLFADTGFELDRQFVVRNCATRLVWRHRITMGTKSAPQAFP